MKISILRITTENQQSILEDALTYDNKTYVVNSIVDGMIGMPHKSGLLTDFTINLIEKMNNQIDNEIIETINNRIPSLDVNQIISLSFALKKLGLIDETIFKWVKNTETKNSTVFSGAVINAPEKNTIEMCEKAVEETIQFFNNEDLEIIFSVVEIIRNFAFSIPECVNQLYYIFDKKLVAKAILYLRNSEIDVYLLSLATVLSGDINFFYEFLNLQENFCEEFKDLYLTFVLDYYYNPEKEFDNQGSSRVTTFLSEQEVTEFKKHVTEKTVKVMKRIINLKKLKSFFKSEFSNEFENNRPVPIEYKDFLSRTHESKEEFFKDFCYLGSPSPTHFLSYLEMYKNEFKLDEEQQRMFLNIFIDIFKECESFIHIIAKKLILFNIVDSKLVDEIIKIK